MDTPISRLLAVRILPRPRCVDQRSLERALLYVGFPTRVRSQVRRLAASASTAQSILRAYHRQWKKLHQQVCSAAFVSRAVWTSRAAA